MAMKKSEREKCEAMVGKSVYRDGTDFPVKLIGFTAGYFVARAKRAMPFIIYPKEIGNGFSLTKPCIEAQGVTCPTCNGHCDVLCEECDGQGCVDCEDCGMGTVQCHSCGYDHECETCKGTGRRICDNCDPTTGRVDCMVCRGTGVVAAKEGT